MDGSIETAAWSKIHLEPSPSVRLCRSVCPGVTVETVSMAEQEAFESRYFGPLHLLIAHERLARHRGETTIEGLSTSSLRNLSGTLTFVPAGCRFREWHNSDVATHATYIHIDPRCIAMGADQARGSDGLTARLHFKDPFIWQTVLKVKALVKDQGSGDSRYAAALGILLAHELVHLDTAPVAEPGLVRGGLAVWQQQLVAQYVEKHLSENIPIAKLAEIARLSRYHFCHSFRYTFGIPPHRYHSIRKVERAKALLRDERASITKIALDLGYSEASAFSTVFRKLVGLTPINYRRSSFYRRP